MLGCKTTRSEGQGRGAVRAAAPRAQQLVTVGPVWAHRAVGGGRVAVGVAGGAAAVAGRCIRGRAITAGHVGTVLRAIVGGAGDGAARVGAARVEDVIPLG